MLSVEDINKVNSSVRDFSAVGIMLYFGASQVESLPNVTKEVLYKPYLLMHAILGLRVIQSKGNMVLKCHEVNSNMTVGLIFILYSLFDQILVLRPFSTSPLS